MKSFAKILITIAVGTLGCFIVYMLLIAPSTARTIALSDELRTKRQEEITLEQQALAFRTAQSDLSKATDKNKVLNAIVDKEHLVTAIQSLEAGANLTETVHELKINEEAPGKPKPVQVLADKGGLTEVPYRISTINTYAGTIRMLEYLEHLPQFTEIYKINLSAELKDAANSSSPTRTGRVLGSIDGVFLIKTK